MAGGGTVAVSQFATPRYAPKRNTSMFQRSERHHCELELELEQTQVRDRLDMNSMVPVSAAQPQAIHVTGTMLFMRRAIETPREDHPISRRSSIAIAPKTTMSESIVQDIDDREIPRAAPPRRVSPPTMVGSAAPSKGR